MREVHGRWLRLELVQHTASILTALPEHSKLRACLLAETRRQDLVEVDGSCLRSHGCLQFVCGLDERNGPAPAGPALLPFVRTTRSGRLRSPWLFGRHCGGSSPPPPPQWLVPLTGARRGPVRAGAFQHATRRILCNLG